MPPVPDYWPRVFEAMRDAALIVGMHGRVEFANRACNVLAGYESDGLVGTAVTELFDARGARIITEPGENAGADTEVHLNTKSGQQQPLLATCSPLSSEQGKALGVLVILKKARDYRAELHELKKLEQRWRSIAENPFDFVVVVDRDYKYQFVNHTAPGIRAEDLVGKMTPFDFTDEPYQADMRRAFETTFSTGKATSYEVYVSALGRWFSNIVGPVFDGDEVVAISILTRDISEAKRAEQHWRDNERRMALALRGSADGLWDMSVDTGEIFYSPRFFELLGYDDGDPELEPHVSEFRRRLHPDDAARAGQALNRALEEGEVFDCEYRLRTRSGEYCWFNGRGRRVEGPDGARFAGFLTDISAKKREQAERRALDARLRETHKLETIGTLAGGIAHDFNNLLTPIIGFTQLAMSSGGVSEQARTNLEDVLTAAERARGLVSQILTFSRREEPTAQPVDLAPAIDETLRLLTTGLPAAIEVKTHIEEGCALAMVDPTQLQQILANLCTNAAQALGPSGGTLELSAQTLDVDSDSRALHDVEPGRYVHLSVRDSGPGMTPEVMERAFEPFFTTKGVGKGTGLGLSVVKGIALSHGGNVRLESTPGNGTTVHVLFPTSTERRVSEWPASGDEPRGSEHVLLVDDEDIVLRVERRLLEKLGYRVTVASNGSEALEKFRELHASLDLVVTDQAMPGLTGAELLPALREYDANVPVILTTGFSEEVPAEKAYELGFDAFVAKPNVTELGSVVRAVLDRRASKAQASKRYSHRS